MAMSFTDTVHCSIGFAAGEIQTCFPNTVAREQDLFGKGLSMASRYESTRHSDKAVAPVATASVYLVVSSG